MEYAIKQLEDLRYHRKIELKIWNKPEDMKILKIVRKEIRDLSKAISCLEKAGNKK